MASPVASQSFHLFIFMATICIVSNLLRLTKTVAEIIAAFTIFVINALLINAKAQNINFSFDNPNGIQGVSESYINAITQDKTGFIWIGSDDGLAKFDGYNSVVYRHKADDANSIPDDQILALLTDDAGILWIGTRNGLSRYSIAEDKFQNFFHDDNQPESIGGNHVYSIAQDKQNNIWVGLYGAGLDLIVSKKIKDANDYAFKHFTHDKIDATSLSSNQTFSVCFDKAGNGWIGTEGGLNFFDMDSKKFTRFLPDSSNENSIANISAYKLFPANDGSIWVCGKSMIDRITTIKKDNSYAFSIKHFLPLIAPGENLSNWNVNRIILDEHNNGWVATNDFGLIKFTITQNENATNVERFTKNETVVSSIASSVINEIFEDQSGIIWIGTGKGISKYIPSKNLFNESSYTNDVLLDQNIFAVQEDNDNRLWIGYESDTVTIIHKNNHALQKLKLPGAAANKIDQVNTIFKSSKGDMYIGTLHQGIFIFSSASGNVNDTKNWAHFFRVNTPQLNTNNIYSFAEDKNQNIWIGTYKGVYKYQPAIQKLEPVYIASSPEFQPEYMINTICIDQNNLLWCGTGNGLYVLKDGKLLRTYKHLGTDSNSLNNDQVMSIIEDHHKKIWVATKGGLNLFNNKTNNFIRINNPGNFPQEAVKILQEDKDGNLWIGLNTGLVKFNTKENTAYTYKVVDGLCSNQFQPNANCSDNNGLFYFGTSNGIVSFDPAKIKPNSFIPSIVITGVKVMNEDIFSTGDTVLTNNYKRYNKILLNYNQNFFSFEYAALNYINSAANQYMYMLEGVDKAWIQSGTKRFADYTDIKPGNYTFKVKGSNNDGIWNNTPAIIEVIITPPWWQTWWFYALCATAVAIIIYIIYRVRLKQVLKLYKLRSSIAKDLHDDVGSALSSIALLSKIAQEEKINSSLKPEQIFSRISDTSKRMIDLMDDIVWSVNPDNDRFENMIIRMREYAVEMLEAQNIQFSFLISENMKDVKIPMQLRKDYFLIFKEAVNNLAKYAQASTAMLSIEKEGNIIITTIKDNGTGFDADLIHSGNGLKNMKQRAHDLKATLDIQTVKEQGTTIILRLPVT